MTINLELRAWVKALRLVLTYTRLDRNVCISVGGRKAMNYDYDYD